ncbi:MAG TPA: type II toxin-antitoxin system VapC family toxin [Ktedonobacteraceae bacterium]|nr:type II toxin-antitoxin system VapC family toxin [Ktedonobacteraceae bacterium]
MSSYVLDASALMALFHQELGSDKVEQAIEDGAAISTVNLSEVASKLNELGTPEKLIQTVINVLELNIVDFNTELAYKAGLLRPLTKRAGLSLGDRACLALAQNLNLPALTADRAWETLSIGIKVQVIR